MSCEDCKKGKLGRIIEGWGNFVFRNPEAEAKAVQRARICAICLQMQRVRTEWCPKCGCYIPAKIRSMSEKCPDGKW